IFGTVVMDGEDKGLPMMSRYHAEPALLDLLQLETVEGSLEEVFADPRAIAIEARLVERLFGSASPLGHTLTFKPPENQGAAAPPPQDFVIRAVYSLPQPSTFNLAFLALLDTSATLPQPFTRLDLWQSVQPTQPLARGERPLQPFNVAHYFKLREGEI